MLAMSEGPGTGPAPEFQLLAMFQLPPSGLVHEIVAASERGAWSAPMARATSTPRGTDREQRPVFIEILSTGWRQEGQPQVRRRGREPPTVIREGSDAADKNHGAVSAAPPAR